MTRQQELGLKEGQVPFEGDYRAKMQELRAAGLTPWSTEDIIAARNAVPSSHPLWDNYVDTDFGIAATRKKIYLAPHSARLHAVTPETRLTNNGGLLLSEEALDKTKTYDRGDIILCRYLTETEARNSQVWLDFANGDQNLLDKYVENTFRFGKDRVGYDTMMGIFVPKDKEPVERAVVLYRLGGGSQAIGDFHLDYGSRFVGVRRKVIARNADKNRISAQKTDPRQFSCAEGDAKKNQELYENSAMSGGKRLEQQIAEMLSPFDKYMGTFAQSQYQQEKKQVTTELLALLKK